MRKLALLVILGAGACANPGFPRGAPPDALPPELVRTEPVNGAVNVKLREVEFFFDEVLNERPAGVSSLQSVFVVSPGLGLPRVDWNRKSIAVRPRGGWLPNTTYSITVLSGLTDLQGNTRKTESAIVFSTGPQIDSARIEGIVFDWVEGRTVPRALVEARPTWLFPADPRADRDTIVYPGISDSTGRFVIANLPRGEFQVRAVIDVNNNRVLDALERYDTALVQLQDSARVELLAFAHDTLPPQLETPTVRDSFTVRVRFSRPLQPGQQFDSLFTIMLASDSTPVPIVLARPELPSDRAVADTTRPDTGAVALRPTDTLQIRPAVAPSIPSPPQVILIQTGQPLRAGTRYILQARDVRGLLGASFTHAIPFTVPEPPQRVDTLRAQRRE